jgi:hypothetical protein
MIGRIWFVLYFRYRAGVHGAVARFDIMCKKTDGMKSIVESLKKAE